jgi:ketosteroid isomerase-like protein
MQSEDVSKKLSEIDRDLMAQRLVSIIDSYTRGDIEGMLRYATPDVVYAGGSWRLWPMMNRCEGALACGEMLRAIHVAYESSGTVVKHMLIDGPNVALCRTTTLRNRGSGRFGKVDIWNFVRFRDGLVCEYSEYPDTAAIAALDG